MGMGSRIRAYASLGLIKAGQALAGPRYGDGWNGIAALPAKTVLDIGACGGELAERELLDTFPLAEIHCFEPHPVNFARLKQVAARHDRIKAHPIALGDAAAQVEMNFNPGSPSSSSLRRQTHESIGHFPQLEETQSALVTQCRLDDWAAEFLRGETSAPIVIKMDVQGFEDRVIAGGQETLGRAAGVILEVCVAPLYEGQPTFAELHSAMESLGYGFAGTRDQYFGRGGEVIYLDACFLKKDIPPHL